MDRRRFLATTAAATTALSAADAPREWREYSADAHSSRYSPLDQINTTNVSRLEVAWTVDNFPARARPVGLIECNPIVVDGVMYVSGYELHTHAIEAHTGKVLWTNPGFTATARRGGAAGASRGVTYWKGPRDERIFAPVREHILAINAKTGKLIDSFGKGGAIHVREDLDRELEPQSGIESTTPGIIVGDLLIISTRPGEGPRKEAPGHIRAYDCHTGKRKWIFHTIPHPGEFGYDTWPADAWKRSGGANCWGGLSVDHARKLVYVATGSPTFDFWGGDRKGMNLYGNCVICLKAETGERVWHYQAVHHDLFDYDFPCAPNLVTVRHNGRMRDAVAQVSKQGWVYLLDRVTGTPLYPIDERAVAKSTVPGEESWPTQPFVTQPPAFSRLGVTAAETTSAERMKDVDVAPMFTPPRVDKEVLVFPGYHGGANWGGASWVAGQGVLYINHNEIPWSLKLVKAPDGAPYPYEHTGYLRPEDENGYPAIRPPWGRLTALDLHNSKILWQAPLGEYPELTAKGVPVTGTYLRGGNIATKGGLIFTGAAMDNMFRAFDQRTGKVLWQMELAGGAWATPSTYEANGKQYVVIATSPRERAKGKGARGGFTAFALPG